ncbi:tetratricopeptide repeat protein [Isosphaeraceae bacterium EP7]
MAGEALSGRVHRRWWLALGSGVLLALALGAAAIFTIDPTRAPAWWPATGPLARAFHAERLGDWEQVSQLAREVARANPKDSDALLLLARSSAHLGRHDQALAQFKRVGPAAMDAEDNRLLSASLLATGRDNARLAGQILEKSLTRTPDHAPSLADLARILAVQGDLPGAVMRAEALSNLPGHEPSGLLLVGLLRSRQGDHAGAAKALARAFELDPAATEPPLTLSAGRKLLATSLLKLGRGDQAAEAIEPLLAHGPDPDASWLLSRALIQRGDAPGAIRALAQAGNPADRDPLAPEPAPYVGSDSCTSCHPAIARAQAASRHARTFATGAGLEGLAVPSSALPDPHASGVRHAWKSSPGALRVEAHAGDRAYRALVEFALGTGDRGMTLVGPDDRGVMRELRMSRYDEGRVWDVTTGHQATPADHADYLGKALTAAELARCIGCHTTVPGAGGDAARDPEVASAHAQGIRCERCHGPAGNHLKAVALKLSDPAIARPSKAGVAAVTRLCGQCHSPGHPVDPDAPASARFQAETLPLSACVVRSGGALGCVTCHAPHRDVETSAAAYEPRCLACHSPEGGGAKEAPGGVKVVPCPVNPRSGCIACHMPKVGGDVPHSTFTDHFIRAHPGGKAPPKQAAPN